MKIAFAGTPTFAEVALRALHQDGHELVLVLTQPDRPAGRGLKLQASPVKQLAQALGVPVAQPRSLRLGGKYPLDAEQAQAQLQAAAPQALVVAAYGLILPAWTLALPPLGCINIHASCLPRWRGAAPIHRAIEAGDTETGITIMQMDEGLDTGEMWSVATEPIHPGDTTGTLHDRLATLGGQQVLRVLQALGNPGSQPALARQRQPEQGVCYAHKVEKAEALLDWQRPATELERKVRAFNPFPGCHARLAESRAGDSKLELKVWQARCVAATGVPGQRLPSPPDEWWVACGEGALQLLEVQQPGGKRLPTAEWLRRLPAATHLLPHPPMAS
jgi:methionyl-tRNA formyltransferase